MAIDNWSLLGEEVSISFKDLVLGNWNISIEYISKYICPKLYIKYELDFISLKILKHYTKLGGERKGDKSWKVGI